ncbi:hypothetical protein Slin15195_G000750 [Septoria linicola]|uniref:Uncharacterized protein n=1 Tax=Septoria linicola TaxID=215465 RepID=A0A9Q9ECJ3_9PEZI|nr:hypothetical protein Slin15195_G000750 [Septoria linicola]
MMIEKYDEDEQLLRGRLDTAADPDEWLNMGADYLVDELEIVAGVILDSRQQWQEYGDRCKDNTWVSMYAYCRPAPDQDDENSAEDFSWRVVFYHRINDNDRKVFTLTSIAKYLGCYASWDQRMNMEDMRKATSGCGPPWMGPDSGGYSLYD